MAEVKEEEQQKKGGILKIILFVVGGILLIILGLGIGYFIFSGEPEQEKRRDRYSDNRRTGRHSRDGGECRCGYRELPFRCDGTLRYRI